MAGLGKHISEKMKALHPKILTKDLGDLENVRLLTKEEVAVLEQYIKENPGLTKISRKTPIAIKHHEKNKPGELTLRYSVIIGEDGNIYALYKGKEDRMLGKGGFGRVKLAQNIRTGEWVAAKIVTFDYKGAELDFKTETELQQKILGSRGQALRTRVLHPSKGYLFIPLSTGNNLAKYLQSIAGNMASLETKLNIALKLASGLKEFHDRDYIHCDIKPQNVMYDRATGELKFIDVGFVQNLRGAPSLDLGGAMGTAGFMSPEIINSHIFSKKSDIYALAFTFAWVFNEILIRKTPESFAVKTDIKKRLDALMSTMIDIDPNRRPRIEEIIKSLHDIQIELRDKVKAEAATIATAVPVETKKVTQALHIPVNVPAPPLPAKKKEDEKKEDKKEKEPNPILLKQAAMAVAALAAHKDRKEKKAEPKEDKKKVEPRAEQKAEHKAGHKEPAAAGKNKFTPFQELQEQWQKRKNIIAAGAAPKPKKNE